MPKNNSISNIQVKKNLLSGTFVHEETQYIRHKTQKISTGAYYKTQNQGRY